MTTDQPEMNLAVADSRTPLYRCEFSPDRVYRYVLKDTWDEPRGHVMFIGLNPSTADECKLDPTLNRVREWAKSWGYGGFIMCNLFAFRSPHPDVMRAHSDPVGPENDKWILRCADEANLVVAAWGRGGSFLGRDAWVDGLLKPVILHCLRTLGGGVPIHPHARGKHRVPNNVTPQVYRI